ncbi:putative cytosolic iron-sulfur protein assembly protein CIAO1-like [Dirofilaria immitis]|nr:putative cytosolic iron-sulfur protein assembly protein CIAO1-like [Dirofilaria immitis]
MLQNVEQDEALTNAIELKSTRKAQTFDNSPIDHTLSLLDANSHGCSRLSTPISSTLDDSLDITIYWADEGGLKFSVVGGKLATASSLLVLLSDHLGVVAEVFEQVCALWMVSDLLGMLLEVQLKPHHNPYEIRKSWMQFLQRFTSAESNESVADEPLLILKRNVQLSVQRECELEENYANEILTEILYRSAKQEVLGGRYICDIDSNIKLAALQMIIDLETSEDTDMLDMFAAAFFRGYVERPIEGPLKGIKKMILSVASPNIPVLVGISCGYVTLSDETKQEVLLVQRLYDCDCRYVDDRFEVAVSATVLSDCPYFLLTFPDTSFVIDRNLDSEAEILKFSEKTKVLQVFSKQGIMVEALMNSLSKFLEQNGGEIMLNLKCNDCRKMEILQGKLSNLEETVSSSNSPNDNGAYVANISVNEHNLQQNHAYSLEVVDGQFPNSISSSHTNEQTGGNSNTNRNMTDVCSLPNPFISNRSKLCLATLDADGHCLEAQGSLRVLLEVISVVYKMISDVSEVNHSYDVACRVWCVQWNHTGTTLASCGDDKTIKLWKYIDDAPYLAHSGTIKGSHSRAIRHVAFSPSDKFLASTGFDAAIVIHQLCNNDYEEINRLEGHENEVKCCAFSASGEYLATCSRDKSVWFWQLDEGEDFEVAAILQSHTQDVKFVVWHPVDELLVSCGYDCSIRFYRFDGEDWITQQKIDNAHESTVWSADFSDDGNSLVTVGADFNVNIWMRQETNLAASKSKWNKVTSVCLNTKWPLYSVSWNKLHGIIAVGGGDSEIRLYRLSNSTGSPILEECDKKISSEINCLSWNPLENRLLTCATDDGEIYVLRINL